MANYRLLGCSYKSKDGKTYEKGDIVESNRELDKKFVGLFEKLPETVVVDKQPETVIVDKQSDIIPSSESGEEIFTSPLSEKDVTKQFPYAKRIGGINIIRVTDGDKEYYNIVDSGNGQLHNSKPILSIVKVNKFLRNLVTEEVV